MKFKYEYNFIESWVIENLNSLAKTLTNYQSKMPKSSGSGDSEISAIYDETVAALEKKINDLKSKISNLSDSVVSFSLWVSQYGPSSTLPTYQNMAVSTYSGSSVSSSIYYSGFSGGASGFYGGTYNGSYSGSYTTGNYSVGSLPLAAEHIPDTGDMTEEDWEGLDWLRNQVACQCNGRYCNGSTLQFNRRMAKAMVTLNNYCNENGYVLQVTSGMRCLNHNLDVASSGSTSKHIEGRACDIWIYGKDGKWVSKEEIYKILLKIPGCEYISTNPTYDGSATYIGDSNFVHFQVVGDDVKLDKVYQIDGVTYVDGVLIANKSYALPSNYNPGVNKDAQAALNDMQKKALEEGIDLPMISGFRSYSEQNSIYTNYVNNDGQADADKYSARPGHSEHQTGLAFDLVDPTTANISNNKAEFDWLAEHAHEYGFIIRYPEGKEHITGYQYEPWHVRYVGVETATAMKESGLCFEEYFDLGVSEYK